ncbi:MAG TPA: DUF5818 domain-containing protein [Candidatus Sulfotelmatobacter sp.]|nr:DUF5818 domain-containing protein [Candidatus Sulfotelmatobacter sp.]HLM82238.1 DUF5818 domain-containing protein [Terriglobales bacterium]
MKRFLPIIALLGLTGFALAQNSSMPDQTRSTAQQEQETDAASAQHQSARSFEGTIEKAGGKLVLQETSTQTAYQLDDQDKAKQYLGKNVKVMATMDPKTNTLHVVDISPAESR